MPPPDTELTGDYGDVRLLPASETQKISVPDLEAGSKRLVFTVGTDAFGAIGLEADDFIIADMEITPTPGALVVAQIYDLRMGDAETVIRWFEPPYLIAPSLEPDLRRPVLIDHETVEIRGVIIRQLRVKELFNSG